MSLAESYAALVDARDWDGAAALFAEDGVLVVDGETHAGREAIRAAFAQLEHVDSTHHDLTGVDADGHVTCVAHHVRGERCTDWHVHYVDTVADGRFTRRELHLDRVETHRA